MAIEPTQEIGRRITTITEDTQETTFPRHIKYVATLPGNLSLIACFLTLMFHKVV